MTNETNPGTVQALEKCRDQFKFYVEQHMAKSPPDTAKAATNLDFVELCEKALAALSTPPIVGQEVAYSAWRVNAGKKPTYAAAFRAGWDAGLRSTPSPPPAVTSQSVERIKTWEQRCEEHPDHEEFCVTPDMIQARMQEEIDDLRVAQSQPAATVQEVGRDDDGGPCYCWCHPNAGTISCSPCCDAEDNYLPPSKRNAALTAEPAAKAVSAISANWDQQPSPQPDMGSGASYERERVAKALEPALWSDDEETAHKAASPLQVCYARERSLIQADQFLAEYAALSPPASQSVEKIARKLSLCERTIENHYHAGNLSGLPGIYAISAELRDIRAALPHKEEATPAPVVCPSCDGTGVDLYDGTEHDCQICGGRGATPATTERGRG